MSGFTGSDFWDARYKDDTYFYGAEPNEFLSDQAGLFGSGDCVLSLAEGEGRNAVFLAERGCRVRGVDFSPEGQAKALALASERGVSLGYDLADLMRYDMGVSQWDAVISIFCHMSREDRPPLYQAIRDGLKPGGIVLIEGYNAGQLDCDTGGPKDINYLTSLDLLHDAFDGFEILLAQDTMRGIREGAGHTGMGSVTQFIARKS